MLEPMGTQLERIHQSPSHYTCNLTMTVKKAKHCWAKATVFTPVSTQHKHLHQNCQRRGIEGQLSYPALMMMMISLFKVPAVSTVRSKVSNL
jgi:hypothetical protein